MKRLTCTFALLLSLPFAANGATLTATPSVSFIPEGFTIDFTDLNGDSLLEFGEIDSFSGFNSSSTTLFAVNTVPDIAGFALFSFPVDFGQASDRWRFNNTNPGLSTFDRDWFTYDLVLDTPSDPVDPGTGPGVAPIPLPAGMALMVGALGLLGLTARRRSV